MYKLLVVEDEEAIRKGIIKSIDWEELGYVVVGDVANGREGLEFALREKPDVILTDVRMPVMDGLAMAEAVLAQHSDIRIVILSGFADFEYAQQAIRFQVFDYLLKPTDKNKFIQCFIRLKNELDEAHSEFMIQLSRQEKMYDGLMKLREDFIIKALDYEMASGNLLSDWLDYLEIDFSGRDFAAGIIKIELSETFIKEVWGNEGKLLKFSYYNIANELLLGGCLGIPVVKSLREIIFIFNFKDRPFDQAKAIVILKKGSQALRELLGNKYIRISSGLGAAVSEFSKLPGSYEQASISMDKAFYNNDSGCYVYRESSETAVQKKWLENYPSDSNMILDETLAGNAQHVEELISAMFDSFQRSSLSPRMVMDYAYNLCFKLHSSLIDCFSGEGQPLTERDYKKEIYDMVSIEGLKEYVLAIFKEAALVFSGEKTNTPQDIIQSVKRFIKKNYSSDISLEMLSRKMFISPSYLSYLFKNVTGESYSDYLKNIRLNRAKELLEKNSDLKVFEVCYMVGYKEYKYFSQQFKKAFGTNPTELRKGMGRGTG